MSAGHFNSSGMPYPLFVESSDCASFQLPADHRHLVLNSPWVFSGCTSDPVVVGTALVFYNASTGAAGSWTVTELTATPKLQFIDYGAIVIALYLFMFFMGFHTGGRNGRI